MLSSEKLNTFLALTTKDLGLAPFHEDIERLHHNIYIHAMPFYRASADVTQNSHMTYLVT